MRPTALVITVLALSVGACSGASDSPTTAPNPSAATVSATIAITVPVGGEAQPAVGSSCGISNIPPAYYGILGLNVQVKNESGTIVGAGSIPQTGIVKKRVPPDAYFDKNCSFEVAVTLDGAATFYELDLGQAFGTFTKSRADLGAADWRFEVGW